MKSRGALTWFSLDCCIHSSPKVIGLSKSLGIDLDTTVGKLCRLYAWVKTTGNVDGFIGKFPEDEIAGIMRWNKKPAVLVSALISNGILEEAEAGYTVHGWYEANGKSTEKAIKDANRPHGNYR